VNKYQLVSLLWLISPAFGQNLVDLRTQTKDVNFSAATSTIPEKSGTALPATCNPGEMFFSTSNSPGQKLYTCSPANTWALVGGSGAGTVASGNLGQFGFYAANGSTIVGHTLTAGDIPALNYQSPLVFTGNGAKTASSTGTLTSNNCAKFDASGNVVDAGAACANIATGAPGQFGFYAANGSALAAHSLVASDIPALGYQSPLTFTGNGAKTASSTGTPTTNNCVKWDSSGNVVDAGAPCGSGSAGVSTFNNRSGAVSLSSSDVQTALSFMPLSPANNLSDLSSQTQARTNLGLTNPSNYPVLNQNTSGNAATASAFDHTPTGCTSSQFANGIGPNGNLTCGTPASGSGNVSTSANMASGNVPKSTGTNSLADGGQAYPVSAFVGVSDVQTLTNKSINAAQINSGTVPVAQLPVATSSTLGAVRPDNATVVISNGVISAVASGSGSGSVIQATNGVICGTGTGNGAGCNGAVIGNGSTTTLRDVISIKDYGAVSDGATDNYTAIQNAINAACAAISSQSSYTFGQGASLLIPGALNSYVYSKPLIVPCSNLTLEGQGQASVLQPSFSYGEAMLVRPAVGTTPGAYFPFPTGAPLVGSTGNSMYLGCDTSPGPVCTSAPNSFPYNVLGHSLIDLGEVINVGPRTQGGMGGLPAFSVEAVVNLDNIASDGYILSSYGQKGNAVTTSAFALAYQQGINAFRCSATIGNTSYGVNALVGAVTTGVTYALACTYDGTTMRMFVNGALASSTPASGTLTQASTENMIIGPLIGAWPLGAYTDTGMVGRIDNVRISNVARYNSNYSPATAKFATDSNTLALFAFNSQFDSFTAVSGTNGNGWAQYQVIEDLRVSFINNAQVKNLAIKQQATGSGLSCMYSPNSKFEHLYLYFGYRDFSMPSNCFESHVDVVDAQPGGDFNGYISGGEWGIFVGGANGIVDLRKLGIYGGEYQFVSSGDSSFQLEDPWLQTEAQTIDSVVINADSQSINTYAITNASFSTESGGSSQLIELMYVGKVGGVLNITGSYFEGESVTSLQQLLTIDGLPFGSTGSGVINIVGNTFYSPATAPQMIKFTSAPVTNPVIVSGNSFLSLGQTPPAHTPITNHPEYLILTPTPSYTVATLPACSPGQNAFATDASSPTYLGTLTGGGPAAMTPVTCRTANNWVSH
jgi:hypothetical protein